VFLRSFIQQFRNGSDTQKFNLSENILSNIEATDINSSAVAAARLSIALTVYSISGGMIGGFDPFVADSLSREYRASHTDKKLDLILMNPPFKGYESLSEKEKNAISRILGKYKIGRTDYSMAFLKSAYDRLSEKGCLAIILPASFIEGNYAQKMRNLLVRNGDIQLIAKFEDYTLFNRGETQIVILIFQKLLNRRSTYPTRILFCRRWPDMALRATEIEQYDTKYEWELFTTDSKNGTSNWILLPEEIAAVLDRLDESHPKLKDIFDIRQGIRIGRKRVFIIDDYHKFPSSEQKILLPLVDDDNLYNWQIHKDGRRLIYAYERGLPIDNIIMKRNFPLILKYLMKFKATLENRARMKDKPIWALAEPRDYRLLKRPKIISTNFGLTGSYAFDKSGKYIITNGNFLNPKGLFQSEDQWYFYLSILNSDLYLRLVSRKSRKLKGGQFDLDQRFTQNVPVPLFENTNKAVRDILARVGRLAHEGLLHKVDISKYKDAVLMAYRIEPAEADLI